MPQHFLKEILSEIMSHVESCFRKQLVRAVLFGSYARGDFDTDSDINIALLLDCTREDIRNYQDILASIATDISLKHNRLVSFICIPYDEYVKWLLALPVYQSIEKEGIKLSSCLITSC